MDAAAVLRANVCTALDGLIGPCFYRLTADFQNDHLSLQWLVSSDISAGEVEDYRCAGTELVARFYSATVTEQFVEVAGLSAVKEIPPLLIHLLSRKLPEEESTDV